MTEFRYLAVDPAGQVARGVMEAASEADVIARLQRTGHIPMRAEPAGRRHALGGVLALDWRAGGLGAQAVADFTRELSIMLGAGQDLDRALRFLVETAPSARLRAVTTSLRESVRDGGSLAAALQLHPQSFSRLYVGLVRAGEAGGNLGPTLDRLAVLLDKQRSLSATIKSAMIYPAVLLLAAVGSVCLLLTTVLPQFVPLFEQNGAALPASTQMLVAAGDAVARYGLYAPAVLAVLALAVRQGFRRPTARLWFDRMHLRLPIIGRLARETLAARFTRTLGSLLVNGVPLMAALAIVRDAVVNTAAARAVDGAAVSARGGAGLAGALGQSGVFPARTIHLLRLGEETAQLGPMALRAADIHEEQARIGVQRVVSLLVPAITIVMGAVIAGIVSSLLLAMLSLNDLAG